MAKLSERLERLEELQKQIQEVAKPIYEEWHDLMAELVKDIIERKSDKIQGLMVSPLEFKVGGKKYQIKPMYMSKEGRFKNAVWKYSAGEMFAIERISNPNF